MDEVKLDEIRVKARPRMMEIVKQAGSVFIGPSEMKKENDW